MIFDNLNYLTLAVFAPLLILIGILGFVIPPRKSLTSGATTYNLFHIFFGLIGAFIALNGHTTAIKAFNLGFGLIDLYQAAASLRGWFPQQSFRWTRVDDGLHIVIGALLVLIALLGR